MSVWIDFLAMQIGVRPSLQLLFYHLPMLKSDHAPRSGSQWQASQLSQAFQV